MTSRSELFHVTKILPTYMAMPLEKSGGISAFIGEYFII
jgi:hypothetical protein